MKYSQIKAILVLINNYYRLPRIEAKEIELDTIYKLKILGYYELSNHTMRQIIDRVNEMKKVRKETTFQMWQSGEISNLGSFQTNIFKAYQIADSGNKARLNTAFPEWFVL